VKLKSRKEIRSIRIAKTKVMKSSKGMMILKMQRTLMTIMIKTRDKPSKKVMIRK
jgi:hypothetical protein